ncbi:MAG TPA: glycosyltransferase family 4 protein [Verrucomicrobiae bacterium]|nr:glycosyltransferase family 4 protein [Verrucomicrobiae bacterium]
MLLLTRHIRGSEVIPIERGGGTETFISSALELPAMIPGLEIDVVAPLPEGGPSPNPSGVRVKYFSAKTLVQLLFVFRNARNPVANVVLLLAGTLTLAWSGLKQARAERYDLIYAVGGPIAGLAGIIVKVLTRVPLVMHFQFVNDFSERNAVMRFLARKFYACADLIIGNCPFFARDSIALGVPESKCRWVFNWVDQNQFKPRNDRAELRRKFMLSPDQTAFLFAGRLDWTKQADRVIDALRDFAAPDGAVFFFAGSGELQPDLEKLARANPKIRILGTVAPRDLPDLHNACDVLLWGALDIDYPSLVVMEAMSSGLPVVTSCETFNYQYEGQLVEPNVVGAPQCARHYPPTREGIRRAITETIGDRAFVEDNRETVVKFARARFGISNAAKLIDIFSHVALRSDS